MSRRHASRGFILLEVMLAVGIFAVGILGLSASINNCIASQRAMAEERLARLALEARMLQIQAGEFDVATPKTEELKGPFAGMTLRQKRQQLELKEEGNTVIRGLSEVQLEVTWTSGRSEMKRSLAFIPVPLQP